MVYVIVDCFTGIWTVFGFPTHDAFQLTPLMQTRWREREIEFSLFVQIRRFTVFVYNRNL